MIRFLRAMLLCFSTQAILAQTGHYQLDFTVSEKDFADTVDIELVEGRVVLPVVVGDKALRFMLDTGSAQAFIYEDTPVEGCTSAGSIRAYDAMGQMDTVPLVKLPPMRIGKLTFTGCQATIHKRPRDSKKFDGIVGFDLICKGIQIKIDTRAGHLILSDRKRFFDNEEGLTSRYRLMPYMHTPYVTVEPFKGYEEQVLLDTGSPQTYVMAHERFVEAEPYCLAQRASQVEGRAVGSFARGLHGRERQSEVVFLSLDSLSWAGFSLRQLRTKTTQGVSHLGAGLLRYGSLTFLPRKQMVRFQPYDSASVVVDNPQVDKVIVCQDSLPVAAFVWSLGKAYEAGLREGDTIVSVDGQRFKNFDEFARFRYLIGRTYTFVVRDRRGFRKTISMKW